jgi:rare lipoprotein A
MFICVLFATPAWAGKNTACKKPAQKGMASWYSASLQGEKTYSGERYDGGRMTAAHNTLPMDTILQVTNTRTGKAVTVRVNDRGPHAGGRMIDLSQAAAEALRIRDRGIAAVEIRVLCPDDMILVKPKRKPRPLS